MFVSLDFLPTEVLKIPEGAGVYHFMGEDNEILYIGKSIHLRRRVQEHLRTSRETFRAKRLRDLVRKISIFETGSELIALLWESHLIKEHKPIFNRAQRRSTFSWGLFLEKSPSGYSTLSLKRISTDDDPVAVFASGKEARKYLDRILEKYRLCAKLCDLERWTHSCFGYQVKRCNGACIGEESPTDYNLRISKWLKSMRLKKKNFWMIERASSQKEWAIAVVENGVYKGFGFHRGSVEKLKGTKEFTWFKELPDNRDIRRILKTYEDHADRILTAPYAEIS